jgi:hypothetical protein
MKTLAVTGISVVVLQRYDLARRFIPVNPVIVDAGEIVTGSVLVWKVQGTILKGIGAGMIIDGSLDLAERYLPAF